MVCWQLDLLPEQVARQYMSRHIRLTPRATKLTTRKISFSEGIKQYSLNLAA